MPNYTYGSPGLRIFEEDRATVVSPQNITTGAIVIDSEWGPGDVQILSSEADLLNIYGKPTIKNYKDWFCAANFLNYSNNLKVLRAINKDSLNAAEYSEDAVQITSFDRFTAMEPALGDPKIRSSVFVRYPGEMGNRVRVIIADKEALNRTETDDNGNTVYTNPLYYYVTKILDPEEVVVGVFFDGELKEFNIYSMSKDAKQYSGATNYMPTAVNRSSEYIYVVESKMITKFNNKKPEPIPGVIEDGDGNQYEGEDVNLDDLDKEDAGLFGLNLDIDFSARSKAEAEGKTEGLNDLAGGGKYEKASDGDYNIAWDVFTDTDTYDVGLLMQGGGSTTVGTTVISVATTRGDAIACISPSEEACVNIAANTAVKNICKESTAMGPCSYSFMDGNYKYQYDKWNDVYRWVPLNGDIAGIFARVDNTKGPWFSPGRQTILNTIKFAFNPTKAQRDELWKYHVNSCVSFNDTGAILYGDQTGADQNTSFNFVNVRRLMLYIEKSLEAYVRQIMFQQNDENTRTRFVQTVQPFLTGLQGSEAVTGFSVICDSTNNTSEIVDLGKFVATVYVKPIRSIRYIELSVISTGSDVNIQEIIV